MNFDDHFEIQYSIFVSYNYLISFRNKTRENFTLNRWRNKEKCSPTTKLTKTIRFTLINVFQKKFLKKISPSNGVIFKVGLILKGICNEKGETIPFLVSTRMISP